MYAYTKCVSVALGWKWSETMQFIEAGLAENSSIEIYKDECYCFLDNKIYPLTSLFSE